MDSAQERPDKEVAKNIQILTKFDAEAKTTRQYFLIYSPQNGKVLDASNPNEVVLWESHGGDNQLWFWDDGGDILRNKKHPNKVRIFIFLVSY